ncbi:MULTISPECIES: ricin-type beta-trefoil lectin domain protein [Streptomyces]|uniref:Ricin-type beta-trefoil lectin domain protein n=2 Tax=Streptomyces TaxID=1883 RepID=A0ABV9J7F2_9ACTN
MSERAARTETARAESAPPEAARPEAARPSAPEAPAPAPTPAPAPAPTAPTASSSGDGNGNGNGDGNGNGNGNGSAQAARTAVPETANPPAPTDPSATTVPSATTAAAADPPSLPQAAAPVADPGQGVLGGRLSSGVLAGAALAGLLLIAAPFGIASLDKGTRSAESGPSSRDDLAGSLPQDDEQPGFVPVPAESSSSPTARPQASATPGRGSRAGAAVPYAGSAPARSTATPRTGGTATAKGGTKSGTKSGTNTQRSGDSGGNSAAAAPQSAPQQPAAHQIVSKLNGRCIDIDNWQAVPGARLQMWDCVPQENQRWRFYPDGTLRGMGMCLTSAWASGNDGSPLQLAACNGSAQQKWVLNSHEDLVNPAADKCADVVDAGAQNGALLQLWSCNGRAHQKWVSR